MRALRAFLLGLAVGSLVAALLSPEGDLRAVAGLVVVGALVLLLVSSLVRSRARRSAGQPPVPPVVPGSRVPTTGTGPGGMFEGRALGDALAFVAAQHGLRWLHSVTVSGDEVDVLGSTTPTGPPVFLAVTAGFDGWHADADALPPDVDLGPGGIAGDQVFQATDLAPDVLSRLIREARQQDARPRVDDADVAAVIDRPLGLRPEVTVRITADDDLTSATWWGSADGRLLFVDQRAEV